MQILNRSDFEATLRLDTLYIEIKTSELYNMEG